MGKVGCVADAGLICATLGEAGRAVALVGSGLKVTLFGPLARGGAEKGVGGSKDADSEFEEAIVLQRSCCYADEPSQLQSGRVEWMGKSCHNCRCVSN